MIRLLVTPDGLGPRLHTFDAPQVEVGSDAASDLVLAAPGVSRRHLRIEARGGQAVVVDAGSSNGTYVNRERVVGPRPLASGDRITIPGFTLQALADGEAAASVGPAPAPNPASAPPLPAAPEALARRAQAWHERPDPGHLLRGEALAEALAWRRPLAAASPAIDGLLAASEAAARRARRTLPRRGAALVGALCAGLVGGRALVAGGSEAYAERLGPIAARAGLAARAELGRERCRVLAQRTASEIREGSPPGDEALQRADEAVECAVELDDAPAFAAIEGTLRELLGAAHGPTLAREAAGVTALAADPGGCHMAWGTADGRLHRWDRCAGERRPRSVELGAPALRIAFAGGLGLVIDQRGEVRRWEAGERGEPARIELTEAIPPRAAVIAADGRRAAIAADGAPRIEVIELAAGPSARALELAEPASALAFTPDGDTLIAAVGPQLLAWGLRGRPQKPKALATQAAPITALRIAECGEAGARELWALSGAADGEVQARPLGGRKGARKGAISLRGLAQPVDALGIDRACRHVLGAAGRAFLAWDLAARDPSATPRALDHERPIAGLAIADDGALITASGRALTRWDLRDPAADPAALRQSRAIVGFELVEGTGDALVAFEDGSLRLWDLAAATTGAAAEHLHHPLPVVDAAVDLEGARVLSAAGQGARLWQVDGEGRPALLRRLDGHRAPIRALTIAADGLWAASADAEGQLLLWPLGEGDQAARPYAGLREPRHLVFTERHLVAASDRGACVITLAEASERRCRELTFAGEIGALAAIPGGAQVAIAGDGPTISLLDLDAYARGGVASRSLAKGPSATASLAISGDGRWLAAASDDGDLRVGRIDGEGALRQLRGPVGGVVAIALAADGAWLAAAAEDRRLHLYRLADGDPNPTLSLEVADATITALAFAGHDLLGGSADGLLRRWSLAGDAPTVTTLGRQRGVIRSIAVAAGGELALSAGDDTSAHLWPLSPRRLHALSRRIVGPR